MWGENEMLEENILSDSEYMHEIEIYLSDERVQSLKNIPHHDSNRLNHSLKVSYLAYKICKKYNLNYKSAAKAGLLHDFYFNRIEECNRFADKVKLFSYEHPEDAVKNAEEQFYLTPLEKDIIVSHMWPASTHIPRHIESFVVSLVDKIYSFKEVGMKWNYKLSFMTGVYFIFLTYLIYK